MLEIKYNKKFKKDYTRMLSRGCDPNKLQHVIDLLSKGEKLPPRHRDHQLENSRNYKNLRECHIQPDWLLVYQVQNELKLLRLIRTGTHSDLF